MLSVDSLGGPPKKPRRKAVRNRKRSSRCPRVPIVIGQKYGRLLVLERVPGERAKRVSARCDCGVVGEYIFHKLVSGHTKSCGCLRRESRIRVTISPGDQYGRLTVLREVDGDAHRKFELECNCGSIVVRTMPDLRSGHTRSCGCLYRETKTLHGLSGHPAYESWYSMVYRCLPEYKDARNYHDRGISVCPEWQNGPERFCAWAESNGYAPGLQLDRRNNDKGYSPDNCRFVPNFINSQNTRRSYYWFGEGKRFESMRELAEYTDLSQTAVHHRCGSPSFPGYYKIRKYKQSVIR